MRSFYRDVRDTTTPEAMIKLLAKISSGQTLSARSTELLLDVMSRSKTGEARLKALLPPGVKLAHKTGSMDIGITNDVGIVELPDGGGRIAIAVYIKESKSDLSAQERAIAHIARAVYDYFLFARD